MNLKIVDSVKKRTTLSKNSTTETIVNYINICFLKYLKGWFNSNAIGGGYFE